MSLRAHQGLDKAGEQFALRADPKLGVDVAPMDADRPRGYPQYLPDRVGRVALEGILHRTYCVVLHAYQMLTFLSCSGSS